MLGITKFLHEFKVFFSGDFRNFLEANNICIGLLFKVRRGRGRGREEKKKGERKGGKNKRRKEEKKKKRKEENLSNLLFDQNHSLFPSCITRRRGRSNRSRNRRILRKTRGRIRLKHPPPICRIREKDIPREDRKRVVGGNEGRLGKDLGGLR